MVLGTEAEREAAMGRALAEMWAAQPEAMEKMQRLIAQGIEAITRVSQAYDVMYGLGQTTMRGYFSGIAPPPRDYRTLRHRRKMRYVMRRR